MAGYDTGDIACWETVWNEHASALGAKAAKPVVAELSAMVRLLRCEGCPMARFYPPPCRFLCRDECLVLGLVSACQEKAWAAADAAARKLCGGNSATALIDGGRSYADALSEADLRLAAYGSAMLAAAEEAAAARLN